MRLTCRQGIKTSISQTGVKNVIGSRYKADQISWYFQLTPKTYLMILKRFKIFEKRQVFHPKLWILISKGFRKQHVLKIYKKWSAHLKLFFKLIKETAVVKLKVLPRLDIVVLQLKVAKKLFDWWVRVMKFSKDQLQSSEIFLRTIYMGLPCSHLIAPLNVLWHFAGSFCNSTLTIFAIRGSSLYTRKPCYFL